VGDEKGRREGAHRDEGGREEGGRATLVLCRVGTRVGRDAQSWVRGAEGERRGGDKGGGGGKGRRGGGRDEVETVRAGTSSCFMMVSWLSGGRGQLALWREYRVIKVIRVFRVIRVIRVIRIIRD
jgi:hypothetical protein